VYLAENTRPARQVGIEAYRPNRPVTIVQLVRCLCCLYAIVLMLSICPVFAQSFQLHSYTEDGGLPRGRGSHPSMELAGPFVPPLMACRAPTC